MTTADDTERTEMADESWDVLVVGGGAAGMTAARAAASEGARTVLVERAPDLGGECTYFGCVPSKALIEVAKLYWAVRRGERWGIRTDGLRMDFAALMAHKDAVIADIARDERPELFAEAGIAVRHGVLRFTGPHEATIDGASHRFERAVIATGSDPFVPPGIGLEDVPHLTNETVFSLTELPRRLVVLGGGPIGLELGQAFGRLGSEVTVLHNGDQLLAKEEPEVGALVADILAGEGLDVRLGCLATGVSRDSGKTAVRYSGPDGGGTVLADAVLVAAGRRPRVAGMGLDALGVGHGGRGVSVDERMRTSAHHVFAAGDVTGGYLFTHIAGYEGRIAGQNAAGKKQKADYRVVPWVTFLDPEIARVGLTEAQAREAHDGIEVIRFPMSRVDRARMLGEPAGFIKLIVAGRGLVGRLGGGEIVGAHIVGPHAGELLHEVVLAMQARVFAGRLAQAIHAYPTASMGVQQAASQLFPIGRALIEASELPAMSLPGA
jgi:pyruvate/2-oxoglutarate dehydrogenase complex dihydrolipoamide dehydrogenase (E3) component